jgi:DNA-binding LacI/PurR family transcriptional regulator
MRHATIIDIARRLEISPSTVSRALRDHPDIKRETKELVRRIAKELHYSPNPIAQSLKSSRTTTIGVIVPEIKHDFFSSAISGIEEVAYRSGYTIILCQSNESLEREVVNTNLLTHHRVAGVVASISQNTRSGEHFIDPPMTTVDQPSFEMGKRAAGLLIDAIEGRISKPATIVVEATLVIRESA